MPSPRLEKLLNILAAEPGDPFTLYGIAQEYANAGDVAQAVSHFDQCLAADPAYCYAYYHKAKVLADHDRVTEAIAAIKAGLLAAKKAGDGKALNELQALQDSLE